MGYVIVIEDEIYEEAGAFETAEEAEEWAQENIEGHGAPDYEIVPFE